MIFPLNIAFASAGIGTPAHLVCELMAARSGIKLTHVPYKGNARFQVFDLHGSLLRVFTPGKIGDTTSGGWFNPSVDLQDYEVVITSYSIHYTKLYDRRLCTGGQYFS